MLAEPRFDDRGELPYVPVRQQVAMHDIPAVLPPLVDEVLDWLKEQNVKPNGAPFFRYLHLDEQGQLLTEVGVPIAGVTINDSRFRSGAFPAGHYLAALHTGPYDRLSKARSALEEWKEKARVRETSKPDGSGTLWGTRAEFYLSAPQGRKRTRSSGGRSWSSWWRTSKPAAQRYGEW